MQRARRYACPGQSHKSGSRPTCPLLVPPPLRRTVALRPDEHGGRPVPAPALPVERLPDPGGDQLTRPTTTGTAGAPAHRPFRRSRDAPALPSRGARRAAPRHRRPGGGVHDGGARDTLGRGPDAAAPEAAGGAVGRGGPVFAADTGAARDLGLESCSTSHSSYVELFRGEVRTCTMLGFQPDAFGARYQHSHHGWDRAVAETDVAAGRFAPTSVADFPADRRRATSPRRTAAWRSTSPPASFSTSSSVDGSRRPPVRQEELCARAEQSAERNDDAPRHVEFTAANTSIVADTRGVALLAHSLGQQLIAAAGEER